MVRIRTKAEGEALRAVIEIKKQIRACDADGRRVIAVEWLRAIVGMPTPSQNERAPK